MTGRIESDIEYLALHVPFLTEQQLNMLAPVRHLGAGGNGSVRLVQYRGREIVVKELLRQDSPTPLLREARVLVNVNGGGGAPRLLAVCQTPPALLQEFSGQTYECYLGVCSVELFLKSLISICQRLEEVHAQGYVHNDIKCNNITFTGSVTNPSLHIIDYGLARPIGETLHVIDDGRGRLSWMAPEVLRGKPVLPSGDVYSFGYLLESVIKYYSMQPFIASTLRTLSHLCTARAAKARPSLTELAHGIAELLHHLTVSQLVQSLGLEEKDKGQEAKHSVAALQDVVMRTLEQVQVVPAAAQVLAKPEDEDGVPEEKPSALPLQDVVMRSLEQETPAASQVLARPEEKDNVPEAKPSAAALQDVVMRSLEQV